MIQIHLITIWKVYSQISMIIEDDAGQDEDDDNINYLKYHMNIDNDTLDDNVANNNVNNQDF